MPRLPLFLALAPALALAATCDSSTYLGADHGPVPCRVIPRCGTEGTEEPTVEGLGLWNPTQVRTEMPRRITRSLLAERLGLHTVEQKGHGCVCVCGGGVPTSPSYL